MNDPIVSVAIICWNQRALIEESIRSVLEQDYPSIEVVVSDDGSSDGTQDQIRRIEREHPGRLKVVLTKENSGITANCNRAVAACSGSLISLHAGDDVMLPGKIAAQVEWFRRFPDGLLCGHDLQWFDSETGADLPGATKGTRRMSSGLGAAGFVEHGCVLLSPSWMFRSESVPAWGFDERIRIGSDLMFAIDLLAGGGRYGLVPEVLTRYRRHNENVTNTQVDAIDVERFQIWSLVEERYPWLLKAVRRARSRQYYYLGARAMVRGDAVSAKTYLSESVRLNPAVSAKAYAWLGLSITPGGQRLVKHLR